MFCLVATAAQTQFLDEFLHSINISQPTKGKLTKFPSQQYTNKVLVSSVPTRQSPSRTSPRVEPGICPSEKGAYMHAYLAAA